MAELWCFEEGVEYHARAVECEDGGTAEECGAGDLEFMAAEVEGIAQALDG